VKEPWKPYHWADKIIHKEKHRTVNLKVLVYKKWGKFVEDKWDKIVADEKIDTYNYYNSYNHSRVCGLHHVYINDVVEEDQIADDEYVLEYG
jgi:hypothetical protein